MYAQICRADYRVHVGKNVYACRYTVYIVGFDWEAERRAKLCILYRKSVGESGERKRIDILGKVGLWWFDMGSLSHILEELE